MIGKSIAHYKIVEKIGAGGMGVIYKAEDTKLDRTVALKFLPPAFATDPATKERFIQEAKSASALQHSNICTIHEIGETDDGQMYIVMDYYEGETLREKLGKGKLDVEEAIDYTVQIAKGLQKAHEKGIVHRDIKPSNIVITNDGEAKILDFGLAKYGGQAKLTKSRSTLGTVAYMSPEQARGDDVDHRSDLWSLGVILFEMVTGELPFQGEYDQAIVYSILNNEPESIKNITPDISSELIEVVHHTLEKNPEDRYQHMNDLINDLKQNGDEDSKLSGTVPIKTVNKSKKIGTIIKWVGIASIMAMCIFLLINQWTTKENTGSNLDGRINIAVMPFKNQTGDSLYNQWVKGLPLLIVTNLSTSPELSVHNVSENMGQSQFDNPGTSLIPTESAKKNIDVILYGDILKAGSNLRLITRLMNTQTDDIIKSETIDVSSDDEFFQIAQSLSEKLRNFFEIKTLEQTVDYEMRNVFTSSAEAYRSYIYGMDEFYNGMGEMKKSIEWLHKAIEIDSNFTIAIAFLAYAYNNRAYGTHKFYKVARDWQKKAYAQKDKLPHKYQLFLEAHRCEFEKKPRERIEWIEKYLAIDPQSWELWHNLGWKYYDFGEYEKAIQPLENTVELSLQWQNFDRLIIGLDMLVHAYIENGQVDLAINRCEELMSQIPEENENFKKIDFWLQFAYTIKTLSEGNFSKLDDYEQYLNDTNILFGWFFLVHKTFYKFGDSANEWVENFYRIKINNTFRGNWFRSFLANYLIDHEIKIEEGVTLAEEARKIDPLDFGTMAIVGWGYYKQGKYELALKLIKQADDRFPKYDHVIRTHLEEVQAVLAKQ